MCVGAVFGVFRLFTFDVVSLVKSLMFVPYFNQDGKIWPLLVPGWTLNFEMFFYVIFAFGLALKKPKWFSAIVLVILVLVGRIWVPSEAMMKVWTSPLLLEFIYGLLLSSVKTYPNVRGSMALIGLGIVIFVCGIVFKINDGDVRIFTCGIPAFFIIFGTLGIERAGYWPVKTLGLELIGDFSYSLYLLHGLIIAVGHRYFGTGDFIVEIGILLVALVVALSSYRLIEKPSGRWIHLCSSG
jgi:exopolysaccharide production protein ExoZ